jgi:hypothetical protein
VSLISFSPASNFSLPSRVASATSLIAALLFLLTPVLPDVPLFVLAADVSDDRRCGSLCLMPVARCAVELLHVARGPCAPGGTAVPPGLTGVQTGACWGDVRCCDEVGPAACAGLWRRKDRPGTGEVGMVAFKSMLGSSVQGGTAGFPVGLPPKFAVEYVVGGGLRTADSGQWTADSGDSLVSSY